MACVLLMIVLLSAAWIVPQRTAFAAGAGAAEAGVFDLSDFSFEHGVVELNGEWRFYWMRLLEPDDFAGGSLDSADAGQFVQVPESWRSYTLDGRRLPAGGYATYRLILRFDESEIGRRFALRINNAATAYRLWIGGRELGGNGVVGTDRDSMVPANYSRTYSFALESSETEIVLQVANFVQRKGGLWDALLLGYEDRVVRGAVREMVAEAVLAGIYLMIGVHHLLLFLLHRENKEALYFGLFSLVIGLRVSVTGQSLLYRLLPGLDWELGVKMEYWGFLGAALLFLLYYGTLFPRELSRRISLAAAALLSLSLLMVTVLPARLYTELLLPFSLIGIAVILYLGLALALALIRSRPYAWLHAIAWLFVLATALNDMLFYNQFIETGDMLPVGILTAVVIQSLMLSVRQARAYRDIRRMSGELARFNESLETKIRERTAELEQANEQLREAWHKIADIEQSRRRLMSNVSHELGTPLSVAQGFVKGMLDGVVPAGDRKSLSLIYEKMRTLDRLIGDLGDLAKLEARMVTFEWEQLEIRAFVERVAESMRELFSRADIRLELEDPPREQAADGIFVKADAVRLEQVLTNLLRNALKAVPAGGFVRIGCGTVDEGGRRMAEITVTDNGAGIPKQAVPLVFDRFYRAGSSSGGSEGMGLGLAICKEIVEIHGGVIGVESEAGRGSRFHVRLPVMEGENMEHRG